MGISEKSDGSETFGLRMTPKGVVTALPYVGTERWAHALSARFSECDAAGLVALTRLNDQSR